MLLEEAVKKAELKKVMIEKRAAVEDALKEALAKKATEKDCKSQQISTTLNKSQQVCREVYVINKGSNVTSITKEGCSNTS